MEEKARTTVPLNTEQLDYAKVADMLGYLVLHQKAPR